ncbi:MAG: carbohydrate porin, partial [Nostocales cyanobacterium]
VERYGCIAGYPNGTYRGNRALTRYEFAAGLNACLDRVNELIATATADMATKQDLATLQRLQEEFSAELATLRGRVDALEARTAELEANQFSTTTKLKGEAIFSVSTPFGDQQADGSGEVDSNVTLSNRVRLTLESSFMGTDKLQTRLNAGNIASQTGPTGTQMARLGHDGVTGSGNNVEIDKLNYAFNFGEKIRVKIDATGAELNENVNVFNPDFASSGTGALSRYGRFSPIYRQAGNGAGITVNVMPSDKFTLSAAYFARGRSGAGATNASDPDEGNGLFDGDNTIFGQLEFKPNKAINIGLAYARTYQQGGGIDNDALNLFDSTGNLNAANPFSNTPGVTKVEADHFGLQLNINPSSRFGIGGWVGYTTANSITGSDADADVFYWAANLAVRDLGREGNTLGLIFGQPPKVTGGSGTGVNDDSGTSYHLEGLYKVQLTENIMVTPGLLVIFNPEHNDSNDTVYVGTLRTTFRF